MAQPPCPPPPITQEGWGGGVRMMNPVLTRAKSTTTIAGPWETFQLDANLTLINFVAL